MANNNNSRIRVNIHNEEEYEIESIIITDRPRPFNPFSQFVFNPGNNMNPIDEIMNALDHVNMLNVGTLFDNFMDIGYGVMSEESMMEIAQRESLNHYKTQEKKPHVKLDVESKIAGQNMKDESCAICVSNFDTGDNITELDCKHSLHTDCCAEWVKYKPECPICRAVIKTVDNPDEKL